METAGILSGEPLSRRRRCSFFSRKYCMYESYVFNYAANCNPCILILYNWQIILFVICNSPESAVPEKITFGSLTVIMQ